MNRQALRHIVLMLTMTFAAQAYMAEKGDIVASIPFDFSIGGQDLRAGEYVLRYDRRAQTLEICEDGVYCAIMPAVAGSGECKAETPRLVFSEREGRFQLRQVLSTPGVSQQISLSRLDADESPYELSARHICIHENTGIGVARSWH